MIDDQGYNVESIFGAGQRLIHGGLTELQIPDCVVRLQIRFEHLDRVIKALLSTFGIAKRLLQAIIRGEVFGDGLLDLARRGTLARPGQRFLDKTA